MLVAASNKTVQHPIRGVAHSTVTIRCTFQRFVVKHHRHPTPFGGQPTDRPPAQQDIPGIGSLPSVAAGLHLTVPVDSQARERELVEQACSVDIEINALSSYWLPDSQTPPDQRAGLVLGFAAVPEAAISAALECLEKAWRR